MSCFSIYLTQCNFSLYIEHEVKPVTTTTMTKLSKSGENKGKSFKIIR